MKSSMRAMGVLMASLFLVMLGFGIIIPILPFYVRQMQGDAATLGLLMASYSIMQFFFAPLWGRLSDRIGRRPVMLIGLSGYGVTFILYGLASQLWMLFAARIMAGVISSATLPTAMAYVADVTKPEDRAKGMGLMGAAMGMGMIVGPALGGALGHYGLSVPFFAAGILAFINLPFAVRFLPESLTSREAGPSRPARRFSRETLLHPQLPLFGVAFVVSFSMALFESTFALFSADRIGIGPREMGIMFAVLGTIAVAFQAGMLGKAAKRFGDVPVVMVGVLLAMTGFVLMLEASSILTLGVFTGVFSFGHAILRPGVSTLVTKSTAEGQGAAVGMMQSFDSLGRILGPIIGGAAYELSGGAPFLIGAVVLAGSLLLLRVYLRRSEQLALRSVRSS